MKVKAKRVLSCIIFLLLLLACFLITANILESKSARQQYTKFFQSDTNFDVIFMGTSHMYNGVLPQELWKNYGITSYNWGYPNCTLAEDYYLLQEIVKYTNPKLVVIDLYGLVEYDNEGGGKFRINQIEQQHVQFDMFPFSMTKYRAVKDVFEVYEYNSDFFLDFLLYHTRWDDLSEEDFNITYSVQKGTNYLMERGEKTMSFVSPDEKTEIESVCSEYIQPIIEFCSDNNIELLFVYLPYGSSENAQRVSNSFMDFADGLGSFNYLNLIYSDIMNYTTDLSSDNDHPNYMGAYKITDLLGTYMQDEYNIQDYRQDSAYSSWWSDYEEYRENRNDNLLELSNVYEKLLLAFSDEYEIEIYDNGEGLVDNDEFISNYCEEKPDCKIRRDSTEVTYDDIDYKMVIKIFDKEHELELTSLGVKNSNMEYDVLN